MEVIRGGDEMGIGGSRYKLPGPGSLEGGSGPDYVAYDFVSLGSINISLSECNTGTTPRATFVVNTTIQLKNITTISDNIGTLVSGYIARRTPLSGVIVIFFS